MALAQCDSVRSLLTVWQIGNIGRAILVALVSLFFMLSVPSYAQEAAAPVPPAIPPVGGDCGGGVNAPDSVPPEKYAKSPGEVDMRTGQFLYSHTDLQIGDQSGLKLERMFSDPKEKVGVSFGALSHNWNVTVSEKRVQVCTANVPGEYDYVVTVRFGSRSANFRSSYDPCSEDCFVQQAATAYAKLEFQYVTGSNGIKKPIQYTYIAKDGARVVFRPTGALITSGGDGCGSKCAYASEIIEADGTRYTFQYDNAPDASTTLSEVDF